MQQLGRRVQWLLFSDIHFRHQDLDRIQQTAQWITALARQRRVQRVVICGDLLTSRSTQSTQVLSACYRFLNELSDAGPHIHVILGNHDLAFKHDYQTTALEALRASRLSPYVSVHSNVSTAKWDGRRVLLLPFREDQGELVSAVAAMDAAEARQTVAFAHLAIHGAITQRHVGGSASSVTYRGLTGPGGFASLARTFTGHFHSHQTIFQRISASTSVQQGSVSGMEHGDPLHGSIVYLGAPLQLTWGDLYDEQRGVVLLDPDTLQHELVISPCGPSYTTVDAGHALQEEIDLANMRGKHVMLTGDLSRLTYVTARDRLLAHGARSVRSWNPRGPVLREPLYARGGLGATVPAGDAGVEEAVEVSPPQVVVGASGAQPTGRAAASLPVPAPRLDLAVEVRKYVGLLDLESPLVERCELLIDVGQRLVRIAGQGGDGTDGHGSSSSGILPETFFGPVNTTAMGRANSSAGGEKTARVFVARPRSLTMTNFLGIEGRLRLKLGRDLPRGLVVLSGENGAGKSTIIEAMTWCQFGRCIRSGMAADDVVNDTAGRDCSVELAFDNGYTITRYRRHRTLGNRVLVSLHGEAQTQLEHAHARNTQAAIDELLGIDYETYVRTVVLGHESATSFLSASPAQRRDLIESALELTALDRCATASRDLLRDMDADAAALQAKQGALAQTAALAQGRLRGLRNTQARLARDLQAATAATAASCKALGIRGDGEDAEVDASELDAKFGELRSRITALDDQMAVVTRMEDDMLAQVRLVDACAAFRERQADLLIQLAEGEQRLGRLQSSISEIRRQNVNLSSEMGQTSQTDPGLFLRLAQTFCRIESRLVVFAEKRVWGSNILLRPLLEALRGVIHSLQSTKTARAAEAEKSSRAYYQKLVGSFEQDIGATKRSISLLQDRIDPGKLAQSIALDYGVEESDLGRALADQAAPGLSDRKNLHQKRADLQQSRQELQQKHEGLRRQSDEWAPKAKAYERARQAVAAKQQELATYARLALDEEAGLAKVGAQQQQLGRSMAELEGNRELLAFWASTLAKKTYRTTSSAAEQKGSKRGMAAKAGKSGKSGKSSTRTTFREYLLEKSLDELNGLMAEVLTVLYEDTRHARTMTTGMLRSLLADGGEAGETRLLDRTLQVGVGRERDKKDKKDGCGLAYGKRSSGERKRMDLALFFALVQLGQAHNTHRAHYLLVDEVLDSLDAAGQAAVMRWCSLMGTGAGAEARSDLVLVVTHSPFLVRDGETGEGSTYARITARVGSHGTELLLEGRLVGRESPEEMSSGEDRF